MPDSEELDLASYYASHLQPGAIDLSISSPEPGALSPIAPGAVNGSFVTLAASEPLRRAIADRYETLGANDIRLCSGAGEALAAVAYATLPGDSILSAEQSAYPSLLNAARHCGATIGAPGNGPKAALAVLTNPGVPYGDIRDTAAFIDEALASSAVPVVDEVYRDLVLDGSPVRAAADLHPLALSIGDLSKPLGLGGLRIGWVATRNRDVLRKVDRELQLLSGGPSSLSVAAATSALTTFDQSVARTLKAARSNSGAVYATLADHGWSVFKPAAGLTAVAKPPGPVSREALARLGTHGYFMLPTSVFGLPGGFRVSLLADANRLDRALGLLRQTAITETAIATQAKSGRRGERRSSAQLPPPAAETAGGPLNPASPCTSGRRRILVVLTKAPAAGRAKTRLAAVLGEQATERLAQAFVADTLGLADHVSWETVVAIDPLQAAAALCAHAPRARFIGQSDGDLGDRISRALAVAGEGGPAVLIGSDTPDLPPRIIRDAFDALQTHDAVLGPARDGGFYLLGLLEPVGRIFAGVEWSTGSVFDRTARNLALAGRSCAVLEEWQDVDDAESLAALAGRLAAAESAPATQAVLGALSVEAPHGA